MSARVEKARKLLLVGKTSSAAGIQQPKFEGVNAIRADAKVLIWRENGRYCYEVADVAGEVAYLGEGEVRQSKAIHLWIDQKIMEAHAPTSLWATEDITVIMDGDPESPGHDSISGSAYAEVNGARTLIRSAIAHEEGDGSFFIECYDELIPERTGSTVQGTLSLAKEAVIDYLKHGKVRPDSVPAVI